MILSAVLMVGVGVTGWGAKATLAALVLLLLAPVTVAMVVWLRYTDSSTDSGTLT